METPESISSETREQFPIGSLVTLSEKGRKFTPRRWWERRGKVVGFSMRQHRAHVNNKKTGATLLMTQRTECMVLVIWEGRTRRRITKRHRSDFVPLFPAQSESRGDAVGGIRQ
jgi:hypothetical protein